MREPEDEQATGLYVLVGLYYLIRTYLYVVMVFVRSFKTLVMVFVRLRMMVFVRAKLPRITCFVENSKLALYAAQGAATARPGARDQAPGHTPPSRSCSKVVD